MVSFYRRASLKYNWPIEILFFTWVHTIFLLFLFSFNVFGYFFFFFCDNHHIKSVICGLGFLYFFFFFLFLVCPPFFCFFRFVLPINHMMMKVICSYTLFKNNKEILETQFNSVQFNTIWISFIFWFQQRTTWLFSSPFISMLFLHFFFCFFQYFYSKILRQLLSFYFNFFSLLFWNVFFLWVFKRYILWFFGFS